MKSSHGGERSRKKRFSVASSGLLTALILAAVLGVLGILWVAHLHGKLHKLSSVEIPPDTAVLPRPGGLDILELHRLSPTADVVPQFTALTAMPGVGMGILQLVLNLPGREPQDMLEATPIPSIAPLLAPITSVPRPSLQFSPLSLRIFSVDGPASGREILATLPAQDIHNDMIPGGTGGSAEFPSAPTPGPTGIVPAPSGFETKVTTNISDRGFDLTISAKNVTQEPHAVVLSWTSRFAIPASSLDKFRMTPPDTADALPSERSAVHEISLKKEELPLTWTGLKYSYLSAGSELKLRNVADGYTLRMIALTPSIHTVRAELLPETNTLALTFSTEGPAGKRTVVDPGSTLQWHVRIQPTVSNTYTPTIN